MKINKSETVAQNTLNTKRAMRFALRDWHEIRRMRKHERTLNSPLIKRLTDPIKCVFHEKQEKFFC
jgi:hypothetical protein